MSSTSKDPRYIPDVPCYFKEFNVKGVKRKVQVVDAKKPLEYWVDKDNIWGSSSKTNPLPGNYCVQENSISALDGVHDVLFQKTVCLVIFKNNLDVARRYIPEQDGKVVAEINDKEGKKGLLKLVKSGPVKLLLLVPRRNRSLEYLQSDEMQEIRDAYVEGNGSRGPLDEPRSSPTSRGFRNGTGKHPWHAHAK